MADDLMMTIYMQRAHRDRELRNMETQLLATATSASNLPKALGHMCSTTYGQTLTRIRAAARHGKSGRAAKMAGDIAVDRWKQTTGYSIWRAMLEYFAVRRSKLAAMNHRHRQQRAAIRAAIQEATTQEAIEIEDD